MQNVSPLFQVVPILISLIAIAIALYWRLAQFRPTDKKPTILPITPSKLKEFGGAPKTIKVGLFVNQFQRFDMTANDFTFSGIVWFEFEQGAIALDTLKNFRFEKAEILKKSVADTYITEDKLLVKYHVRAKFTSGRWPSRRRRSGSIIPVSPPA